MRLTDRRLANIVKQCRESAWLQTFLNTRMADGNVCRVCSDNVNRYIHEIAGKDFSAKDFRTWAGAVLAVRELSAAGPGGECHRREKDRRRRR